MLQRSDKKTTNDIPRSEWRSHPKYSTQALLLGSHDNFRKLSAHLVTESMRAWAAAPTRAPDRNLSGLFGRWKSAMKNHEGYEESKLYPYLTAKYGVGMSILEVHHQRLGLAEDRVKAATRAGDALKFAHALKTHDEILVPHLEQEENMVIPLLLSLTPEEFRRFRSERISVLLQELQSTAPRNSET